jgi:SAM-dependent methyltransferase
MARRFPHVSVLGIDVAPLTNNPQKHPPNVQFQTYDINQGMAPFYGQFDFIQMRCVCIGVHDAAKVIQELLLSLKPGGFLTLIDGDIINFLSEQKKAIPMAKVCEEDEMASVSKDGSWWFRIAHGTYSHTCPGLTHILQNLILRRGSLERTGRMVTDS